MSPVLDARGMRAWLTRWVEWLAVRRYSPRTVHTLRLHVDAFVRWCDTRGLSRPEEITRPIVERYQRYLFHYRQKNGRPFSYGTQNGKLVAVKGYFRWLARQNAIPANPAADIELPRAEIRLPKHVMTEPEAETVIATPDVNKPLGLRDRAIVETLYATAMRRSELSGLSVYDIDHDRKTVRIRSGKGNRERIVPIGERALAWIGKYLDTVRPRLAVATSGDALFLNHLGDPLGPHGVTERVRGIVKRSEIPKTGACHMFRHTAATLMLEGGADIRYVQTMLGHAQLESTAIYTHVSILKLLEVYAATHPAARIGQPPARAKARDEALARAEAADLLTALDDEAVEEDAVANATTET
jgi:integrase/recombinase XerD